MSEVKFMKTNLILTGDLAGKTKVLKGYEFVNGICEVDGPVEEVYSLAKYMGRCYQAYIEGSQELKDAKVRYEEALKEFEGVNGHGEYHNSGPVQEEKQSVVSDLQSEGEGSSQEKTDDQSTDDHPKEGSEGSVSSGNGHKDARVPQEQTDEYQDGGSSAEEESIDVGTDGTMPTGKESIISIPHVQVLDMAPKDLKIKNIVLSLDPGNDSHWTDNGLPAISAVEEAFGSADVTRADILRLVPDYTREKATENVLTDL